MSFWLSFRRHFPDILILGIVLAMHRQLWLWTRPYLGSRPERQKWLQLAWFLSGLWVATGVIGGMPRFAALVDGSTPFGVFWGWFRGGAFAWGLSTAGLFFVFAVLRLLPPSRQFQPERRQFLDVARTALVASPLIATGFGVTVGRSQFHLKEVDVPVPGLPKDLDGLKLVQISDIHLSPFLTEREFSRAVDMANETKAHVALVTGDLITSAGDDLAGCLRQLSRLKTDAGVYGCLGNHEIYASTEDLTELEGRRHGIDFLRSRAVPLRFGKATLNLAGVDYQRFHTPYLADAASLVRNDAFNLLLSHNPDVFDVAASQGFQLTLAGHTHGGQVTVEILEQYLNIARFFTPYVYGLYRKGSHALYVTRGIGTVGLPARVGAPAEVALVRLHAV